MKKIFKLIGIIAIVAVIGFSMTACPEPEPPKEDLVLTGTITISPTSATVNTELTATYSGSEDVTYQWKKGATNVGTNSNKFTPTEAGSYTVTVSASGYKSKTSAAVNVTGGSVGPGDSDWVAVSDSKFGTSDIRGIVHGDGKFVAVGEGGKIAYSADGETWTATDVTSIYGSTDRIDSIAYGNNMFVAVGYNTSDYNGKIATSTDGVTWTAVTTPLSGSSVDRIFYGNGKFIAVGNYRTATSTDGETWTDWSHNSSISISSIAYGNDKFVAVGSGGGPGGGSTSYCKIATSMDGETWTNVDVTSTFGVGYINSIAYGNGMFVAGLSNGRMATSTDGTTWTAVSDSAFTNIGVISKITYGNNMFVAVGLDLVNNGFASIVVTSSDGSTWTAANITSIFVDAGSLNVAYGRGKYIIVGKSGKMAYLSVSFTEDPDLTGTITISPNADVYPGIELTATYNGSETVSYQWKKGTTNVGTNSDKFTPEETGSYTVTVSAEGYKSKTSASVTVEQSAWKLVANSTFGSTFINGIAYGKGTFVAVGGASKMAISSDGKNWTAIPPGLNDGTTFGTASGGTTINGIAYGNNTFVAVGLQGKMATSPDGTTWTKVANNPFLFNYDFIDDIAFGNNMFVAVGANGIIATSPDGTTWTKATQSTFTGTEYIEAIAYGKGTFVAVGVSGKIVTSTNGTTWTGVTNSTFGTSDIYSVTYKNDIFIIGGNKGKMATSPDGTTWTAVDSKFGENAISAIAYGNGMFVAGGGNYSGTRATSTDGTTWTAVTDNIFDRSDIEAIAFGNNMFVAGGMDGKMAYYYVAPTANIDLDGTIAISPTEDVITGMELTATYTGSEEVSYQWKKDGSNVGTNSNKFTPTEAGSYTVTVSGDGYNSKTSDVLSVIPWSWTLITPDVFNVYDGIPIHAITYGNNMFVAVDALGQTATSSNGIDWTASVKPDGFGGGLNQICFGNGKFIATSGSKITTSTNGVNWTEPLTPDFLSGVLRFRITFGNGVFIGSCIGIGSSITNKIATSTDGINWIERDSKFGDSYVLDIAYGNNTFVAVGESGKIATSTDNGATWTLVNVGNTFDYTTSEGSTSQYHITSVMYADGKFIATGNDDNGHSILATSTNNCATWTVKPYNIISSAGGLNIVYGNGKYITTYYNYADSTPHYYSFATSTDSLTWTSMITDILIEINGIVYGGGKFVAVGNNGKIAYLSDY